MKRSGKITESNLLGDMLVGLDFKKRKLVKSYDLGIFNCKHLYFNVKRIGS